MSKQDKIAGSEIVVLVSMRVIDGPVFLNFIGTCFHCQQTVALSAASEKVWRAAPGVHRSICVPCFKERSDVYKFEDVEPITPEQIIEINEWIKSEEGGKGGATT